MTNSSTLHFVTDPKFFAREDGKLYYLPNVLEEPKQVIVCGGTHACTCASLAFKNGANRDVVDSYDDNCPHRYNSALQKAKDNAIEVGNRHDVWNWIWDSTDKKDSLICGHIYTLTGNYSVEIKTHCNDYHQHKKPSCLLAFIKQQEQKPVNVIEKEILKQFMIWLHTEWCPTITIPFLEDAAERYLNLIGEQKEEETQEQLTETDFCKMYESYYGEEITSIQQIACIRFTGEELLEFIQHCFANRRQSLGGEN